jgi:lactate 2-monooxygenase
VLSLVDRGADLAVARACAAIGVPFVFSNQASVPMEAAASAMSSVSAHAAHWFQLYWSSSDELVASLLERAERSGAEAIVVTLDTHMLGWRPRDLDLAYLPFAHGQGIAQYTSDPVFRELVRGRMTSPLARSRVTPAAIRTLVDMTRAYPGPGAEARYAVDTFLDVFSRSSLTWQNLSFLREHTGLPIVLKGIQHPDDARLAIDNGVDAVQVSNHAGRQVDGAIGALDALPGVVNAVAGRIPVLFDSGVRTGSDLLVALALGATAVAVGRPYVYGLAAAGQAGVAAVLRNLLAEFDLSLALAGHESPSTLSVDDVRHEMPSNRG